MRLSGFLTCPVLSPVLSPGAWSSLFPQIYHLSSFLSPPLVPPLLSPPLLSPFPLLSLSLNASPSLFPSPFPWTWSALLIGPSSSFPLIFLWSVLLNDDSFACPLKKQNYKTITQIIGASTYIVFYSGKEYTTITLDY